MSEKDLSKVKTTLVPYEVYTEYDYVDHGSFYFKTAFGDRIYIHSSDRAICQAIADEYSGVKGKYVVVAAKIAKTKFKNEAGIYTCVGTSTRRGQKK